MIAENTHRFSTAAATLRSQGRSSWGRRHTHRSANGDILGANEATGWCIGLVGWANFMRVAENTKTLLSGVGNMNRVRLLAFFAFFCLLIRCLSTPHWEVYGTVAFSTSQYLTVKTCHNKRLTANSNKTTSHPFTSYTYQLLSPDCIAQQACHCTIVYHVFANKASPDVQAWSHDTLMLVTFQLVPTIWDLQVIYLLLTYI